MNDYLFLVWSGSGGTDRKYAISACRSAGVSWLVVLRMTSCIVSDAESPSGVSPVSRKFLNSASFHVLSRVGVRLGAFLSSAVLPPARNRALLSPPSTFRGVWHSPQWPSAWTR